MFDTEAWVSMLRNGLQRTHMASLRQLFWPLLLLSLASAVLSWKLAKMIEAREKEQKKKQKRQENIAKAKRLKKD